MESLEGTIEKKIYPNIETGAREVASSLVEWETQHPGERSLILIAGSAGSGKSTFAEMIDPSSDSLVLSLDRYYFGAEVQQERQGIVNFSIPEALDQDRIHMDIQRLLEAHEDDMISVPQYSMGESKRVGEEQVPAKRRIIVEGVYALRFINHPTPFRIYVDVPDDLLLERRLNRDIIERGVPEQVVRERFEQNVKPAIKQFVKPQIDLATIIVNNSEARLHN